MNAPLIPGEADLERRFGGLQRLYGDAGYQRLRSMRVAVVGLGGVGRALSFACQRLPSHPLYRRLYFE